MAHVIGSEFGAAGHRPGTWSIDKLPCLNERQSMLTILDDPRCDLAAGKSCVVFAGRPTTAGISGRSGASASAPSSFASRPGRLATGLLLASGAACALCGLLLACLAVTEACVHVAVTLGRFA
jgi:hypothetical protein